MCKKRVDVGVGLTIPKIQPILKQNTLLSHHQLSQQEAASFVAGLHLKGLSRATVLVSAIPKIQRTRLVRPSCQLRELDD